MRIEAASGRFVISSLTSFLPSAVKLTLPSRPP